MIFGHGGGFGDDFDYQAFIFGNDNQDGDELHGDLIQVIMTYKLHQWFYIIFRCEKPSYYYPPYYCQSMC